MRVWLEGFEVDRSACMATSVGVGPLRALTVSSFVEKTSIGRKPSALKKPFQGSHGFALPSLTSRLGEFGESLSSTSRVQLS